MRLIIFHNLFITYKRKVINFSLLMKTLKKCRRNRIKWVNASRVSVVLGAIIKLALDKKKVSWLVYANANDL